MDVVAAACDVRIGAEGYGSVRDQQVGVLLLLEVAVLQFTLELDTSDPGELSPVLLARESITENQVWLRVGVRVNQGFIHRVVSKLVGVRGRHRIHVENQD